MPEQAELIRDARDLLDRRARMKEEIRAAINRVSAEAGSDTPDFILADYLCKCLDVFDGAVRERERWYGRVGHPVVVSDASDLAQK